MRSLSKCTWYLTCCSGLELGNTAHLLLSSKISVVMPQMPRDTNPTVANCSTGVSAALTIPHALQWCFRFMTPKLALQSIHLCMTSILIYFGGFCISTGLEHSVPSLNDDFLLQSSSIAVHRASSQLVFSSTVLKTGNCSPQVKCIILWLTGSNAEMQSEKKYPLLGNGWVNNWFPWQQ